MARREGSATSFPYRRAEVAASARTKGLDVARTIEGFADPDADPGDPASQTPSETIWIYRVRITRS